MVRRTLLLLTIALLPHSSPAQKLSAPFVLEDPIVGAAGDYQGLPAVAWTGAEFFVVWDDRRDGRTRDLWFRRFDDQGAGLTPLSLPLVRGASDQQSPVAASGNGAVLVAWLDNTTCSSEVKARRFSPSGQPLGLELSLSTGACTTERPSIAWDSASARWLVAWGAHGAGREVHGALVAADGTIAVPDFAIASAANSAVTPWVLEPASGASEFLVTWSDDRLSAGVFNVFATTVSSGGAVGAPSQVSPGATSQSGSCAAPSGGASDVLITWREGSTMRGQRTTRAGVPSTGAFSLPIASLSPEGVPCAPGPLGSVLLATTQIAGIHKGVYLRVVDAALVVSPEFGALPVSGDFDRSQPWLAMTGTQAFVVAQGYWGYVNGSDIIGLPVSLSGGLSSDAGISLLSTASNNLSKTRAAFDGTNYLTVWSDQGRSRAGSDTSGQLIDPGTGRWLLDGGLALSRSSTMSSSHPSVGGWDGGFFVSWGGFNNIEQLVGRSVSSQAVVGPQLLLSDTSLYVEPNSTRWLVDGWATVSLVRSGVEVEVHLRRTAVTGAVVLPEMTLVPIGSMNSQLDSASLGEVLLTVFLSPDAGLDVRGARYDADAGLLDPGGFDIARQPGDEVDPAVGAGPTLFLVAWSHGGDVLASRVSKQGVLLDIPPLAVGVGPGADLAPAVGWTGSSFLVAWQRDEDVVGAHVSESGALLDATPIILAATAEIDRRPSVSTGPPGQALVTWEAFDESLGAFRGFGRLVTEGSAGVPDAGGSDAGGSDAGGSDAGGSDAGTEGPRRLGVGCSCAQASALGPWVLFALVVRYRNRRRASARVRCLNSPGWLDGRHADRST